MPSQQKAILIVLALVNGLCFCCGLPIMLLFLTGDSSGMTTAFFPEPSPTSTQAPPTPTFTPLPSSTPQATATRVIPLPPALTPAESGWTLYPVLQEGFAISIPSTWVVQNLSSTTIEAMLQMVQEKNPQYAKALGNQGSQIAATGIKFFAFDFTPQPDAPGRVTNLNIIHQSLPQVVTMDSYVGANVKQLGDAGIATKSITQRRINLPAGDATELRYIATMVISSTDKTQIATTQYLLLHSREAYILTFTTDPKLDTKYFPTFEKIAKSLQWTQ